MVRWDLNWLNKQLWFSVKATHLDTTETQQDIQTMQWAPLSVRHEQFAEGE